VVALTGALTLAFVATSLPETLAVRNPQATRFRHLVVTWRLIAADPVFRAWALLVACTYGGLFTVLASSSFVFMDVLGLSPAAYGACMAGGSVSYIGGTLLCRRWIRRHGMAGTVARAGAFTLAAALGALLPVVFGVQSKWTVLVPYCVFAFGHGMHQPCGQAGVVAPFPRAAGAASALAGLLLALVAFGVGQWLGVAMDGSVRPLAYGLAFWCALVCTVAWTLVQRAARR